jgi:acetyl-CoA carboxylase carboxyltransferase component
VYSPALTDFVLMTQGSGIMHITGPQVIKAVTGEDVTSEQLGGAMTHNAISGNAHFFARDEQECYAQTRKLLSYLPSNTWKTSREGDGGPLWRVRTLRFGTSSPRTDHEGTT